MRDGLVGVLRDVAHGLETDVVDGWRPSSAEQDAATLRTLAAAIDDVPTEYFSREIPALERAAALGHSPAVAMLALYRLLASAKGAR
jgi:hypothetical protein